MKTTVLVKYFVHYSRTTPGIIIYDHLESCFYLSITIQGRSLIFADIKFLDRLSLSKSLKWVTPVVNYFIFFILALYITLIWFVPRIEAFRGLPLSITLIRGYLVSWVLVLLVCHSNVTYCFVTYFMCFWCLNILINSVWGSRLHSPCFWGSTAADHVLFGCFKRISRFYSFLLF